MEPHPFTISPLEPFGTGLAYEGPFGPLTMRATEGERGARVTGGDVTHAELRWPEHPPSKHGRSLDQQLAIGVAVHVNGVDSNLRRRPTVLGARRSRRAIHVERPDRPGWIRVRGRGLITLETEAGTPLVALRSFRRPGTVHPGADVVDVATFLLTWGTDLHLKTTFSI